MHRQAQDVRAKTKTQEAQSNYGRTMRQAEELVRQRKGTAAIATLLTLRPGPSEEDLREFAWYHLMSRFRTEQRILKGHRADVYYVAFSPRGDLLASWSKDGTVRIWSTSSWELVRLITASAREVNAGSFAPDGKSLATVDDEGKLKVWETTTGQKLVDVKAHLDDAVIAFFSKDGDTIITGGRNDGVIKFWNRRGAEQGKLVTGNRPLESAALSPDGSILATAGTEGLKLWDVATRSLRSVLSPLTGAQTVVFSHDGTKLAAAFEPGQLFAWDTANGKITHEFLGSYAGRFGAVFSSDDRTISSSDNDGMIRHWDVLSGQPSGVHMGHAGRVWNLALSPAAHMLASAGQDGTVRVWEGEGSREFLKLAGACDAMVGFADGGRTVLALEAGNPWSLGRWDARSGAFLDRVTTDLVETFHFNQFTSDGQAFLTINKQGEVNEWDATTGRWRCAVAQDAGDFHFLTISPGDRYVMLVDGMPARRFLIWDRAKRQLIPLPREGVLWVFFTASDEPILSLRAGELVWWNPATGTMTARTLDTRFRGVEMIISPDDRLLAFVKPGRRGVWLVSAQTFEIVAEIPAQPAEIHSVIFSADGKTLAALRADRTVKLFSTASGEELIGLEGFGQYLHFARFAPDSKTLVTLSNEGRGQSSECRLWRTAAAEP